MIDSNMLRIVPKRIFCPLCGKWHDWEGGALYSYDSEDNCYEYECNDVKVSVWNDKDHYSICIGSYQLCNKLGKAIDFCVRVREFEYDRNNPVIKISFEMQSDKIISKSECKDCEFCDCCNFVKIANNRAVDEAKYKFEFDLEFKFEFDSSDFSNHVGMFYEHMLRRLSKAEKAK